MADKPLCSIPGCDKPAVARGWCPMHYRRWKLYGDPQKGGRKSARTCSIPGCGNTARRRGWCDNHYMRWRNNGDPLGGKTGNGEPQRFLNETVLTYQGLNCLFWPFSRAGRGYGVINISGKNVYVHRLVCESVNGPAPSPEHEAAHTCGNGHLACCNPRHVVWKTPEENAADKIVHGTYFRKDIQKLNDTDVLAIRASDKTNSELAEQYDVSAAHVFNIRKGKRRRRLLCESATDCSDGR